MLHDVGLTPHAASPAEHCFAVRGARYARSKLQAHASEEQLHAVATAISLHLDLKVERSQGLEAHLLQAGAGVDVLGRGLGRIRPPCAMPCCSATRAWVANKRCASACAPRPCVRPIPAWGFMSGAWGLWS